MDHGALRAIDPLTPKPATDHYADRNSDGQPDRHVSGSDPERRAQRRPQRDA